MSTDYAALIAARKAQKATAQRIETEWSPKSCGAPSPWSNQTCDQALGHTGQHWAKASGENPWPQETGHMSETREMPAWAVEPKDLDEYLREHGGRCQHGYSVAEQGCPGCGIDSPEQVVNRYLGGVPVTKL